MPESYYQIPDNGTMFFNHSGEEIPPFGVFQGHDTNNTAENFPPIVIAKKPIDAAANASAIFVNGPNAVENNGFGYAQPGPLYKVLHDGTAAAGDDLGLTDDSFEASPGTGPFVAIGEDDVAENVFLCLLAAGGGGDLAYFYPPSGGVPASTYNTSTDTLTVGSAVCTKARKLTTGVYERGSTTETIENMTSFVVGASGRPMACERNAYGRWTVVVEDCGSTPSTGGGGTTPNPDVGEKSSSSRSIDMGYSLGV